MKVIKVELVPDKIIPEFKRLKFIVENKSLKDILLRGLHPYIVRNDRGYGSSLNYTSQAMIKSIKHRLNEDKNMIDYKDYCSKFYEGGNYNSWYNIKLYDESGIPEDLNRISESLYFVNEFSYDKLVKIVTKSVKERWDYKLAKNILTSSKGEFNNVRRFLKQFDKNIVLRKWCDLNNYDLSTILSVDDFKDYNKTIINHGLKALNFRYEYAIKDFVTEDGYLSFKPRIEQFTLKINKGDICLFYNCHLKKNNKIRFIPDIENIDDRKEYLSFADSIVQNKRYCFSLDIEKTERLLKTAEISFPNLNYEEAETLTESKADVREDIRVNAFEAGLIVDDEYTNYSLASILRDYGEKVSGVKEELINRIVKLLVRLYNKSKYELDKYFTTKFIRVDSISCSRSSEEPTYFNPQIRNGSLKQSVISIYILKHLRAKRILSSEWENTSYSVEELANALINRKVILNGSFMKA